LVHGETAAALCTADAEEAPAAVVVRVAYGHALAAARPLPAGAVVARFEGPIVPTDAVPDSERAYVLWLGDDRWMIPQSPARYLNHSCAPNCRVLDDDTVVTLRPVARHEELTISYNTVRPGENPPPWDPHWSFVCQCGAAGCRGTVAGWHYE